MVIVSVSVGLLAAATETPLSWTSPMLPKLYSNDSEVNPLGRPITEREDAWLGSLVTMGGVIGPFFFLPITDKFGRKPGLLCISVPAAVSYFIMVFTKNLYLLYVARLLGGLSTGGVYALLPNYVAEISEDSTRGRNSQLINVFWAVGNFVIYAIGPFMNFREFNILLAFVPVLFFFLFLLMGTESPYFLVGKGDFEEAQRVIMLLRQNQTKKIEDELFDIKTGFKEEEKVSFLELITVPSTRRLFFICLVLVLTQDLCGFTVILFYMQLIFEAAGMALSAEMCSLIVSVFILTTSFISPFFIDRSGRRFLTSTSAFGMSLTLGILGLYFFAKNVPLSLSWIPLASLILYILAHNFGISSVPYTLISELFPTKIKNTISTAVPCIGWSVSFVITNSYNSMNNTLGRAGTFWVFAGFSFLTGVFSILFVPETKGKSFSEIQEMIAEGRILQICKKKVDK